MNDKVVIHHLATGVPGLDTILGGGLPEFSFNLIVGSPASGKTTLAHQIMFSLATKKRPALYFTALGEPPLKMLRYQQQFTFFDPRKLTDSIRFVDLSEDVASNDFAQVLAHIAGEVEDFSPAMVFVDSFPSMMIEVGDQSTSPLTLRHFIQQLGVHLSGWQATTFMVGGSMSVRDPHPVFSIADGLLSLDQYVHRNSMVHQIQVLKMRGQPIQPGMQAFRISNAGIEIFPSMVSHDDQKPPMQEDQAPQLGPRVATGVPRLDEMLGGGLPAGYSLLVAGPSGSGKTILATAFLAEGARRAERGVIVAFEQTPGQLRDRTLNELVAAGQIGVIDTRALDLSVDEIVYRLVELVKNTHATRVVIDSLSGFELAVAPTFRDFRESLFRLVTVLSRLGVTVLMTSELEDRYTDLRFSPYGSAFLTDAILVERYVEIDSCLKRVMSVVKVRGSAHANELREYQITDAGVVIGEPLHDYEGLFSDRPSAVAMKSDG